DADPAIQRCALALIDRCEAAGSVRVIATSRADADDGELLDELAARLTRWIIHVPPLRARREDIPQLARAFITRFAGRAIEPHPRLARALISHDWPGNIRELEAVIECAIIDAGEREPLPLSEGARRLLGRGRSVDSTLEATAPADIFVIAQSGAWFHVPGAERVEIHHRPTLVRLLRALIVRASERPGESMTPGQLLE
ncbi:MAG: hypothetical protein KDB73_20715, partial [Planctomycetes bacterium]|nr:hypothetical protein [Planctomycetota bacterium]